MDRLRVIVVFATSDFVKLVALRADAMGLVSSGWAWVSDGVIGKINFKGDTPDVSAEARASATRESACRAPSVVVVHRRQSQQDAPSMGGCT
jgi:hypothetical protein